MESGIEGSVTIDDDESEGRLIDEQFLFELIEVELGVAVVDGEVDGLEWLEIADQFLLAGRVLIHDPTREHHQAVIGCSLVKF